jgi:predicted  nucleic acid-binding Zn-ribbon protein
MIAPLAALIRYHELKTEPAVGQSAARASEEFRLLQSIPNDLQKRYVRVAKRHQISAVVPFERGVCTGCHMRQPSVPQEVAEDVYECQNCARLLYDPDVAYDYSVG